MRWKRKNLCHDLFADGSGRAVGRVERIPPNARIHKSFTQKPAFGIRVRMLDTGEWSEVVCTYAADGLDSAKICVEFLVCQQGWGQDDG